MDGDWRSLLIGEAARTSIAATARRLGYSRTAVSLVLAGKYPGRTDRLAAKVLAELGRVTCPHLGREVTPGDCALNGGRMPTSSPAALRLWRACQTCPHNTIHRPETAGKEHAA
ncbi:MAG: LacI family transcriptional regulator [Desulfovibrionaceae bacterium]